jgi:hypothetical protein
MRPKLLKSFLLVVAFWFLVTTLYWGLIDPQRNHAALLALKDLLPFLPFKVPERTHVLNAWHTQLLVLTWWTLPVWALTALTGMLGSGLIWLATLRRHKEREHRETGLGTFRGLTLTLGVLPLPPTLPCDELDLGADDSDLLARLTEKEKKLLGQVLGTLSAAPNAYAGEGVQGTLLENALAMASRALEHRRNPGLSAIAAAASEMGKITAWQRSPANEWSRTKDEAREAARILATLSGWWELPLEDRNALQLAVKYRNSPKEMPSYEADHSTYRLARELLNVASETQEEVIAEEKQKTLEKHVKTEKRELSELIFDAFLQNLPLLAFQNRGLPMGVRAVAWKHGNRVYMLEIELRERTLQRLDDTVRGALTPNSRERSRVQPFTRELLKALDANGWLVRELGQMKLGVNEALWVIRAGKLEFRGIIIIDVPEEHLESLPSQDSIYPVTVLAPLFQQPGVAAAAKADLGGILKPKTESSAASGPAAVPAAAPAGAAQPTPGATQE